MIVLVYRENSLGCNNFLCWNKISFISPSNRCFFFISKGMLLCCLERCTNPLNPVPTGIISPRTTFSFRPFNQSMRPRRAKTRFLKTRFRYERYSEMLSLFPTRWLGNRSLLPKYALFVPPARIRLVRRVKKH